MLIFIDFIFVARTVPNSNFDSKLKHNRIPSANNTMGKKISIKRNQPLQHKHHALFSPLRKPNPKMQRSLYQQDSPASKSSDTAIYYDDAHEDTYSPRLISIRKAEALLMFGGC